ncbi:MAG: GHMP kinase [Desulfovibrio sp.]|jgi:D-glycero-alpha-D-manno-heptose-7-phosphate kinase|nr:GHMP kinase [Desulfovibrio sp.]
MIITRTPLRVSFAGGGSDLRDFYGCYGGAVLSVSIDKFIYLSMHPYFFEDGYLLKYSSSEQRDSLEQIEHNIIREVFRCYSIKGVDFNSSADIPSGTGLGSSSAFAAGLIHLCNAYNETYMSREAMAEQAAHLEIDVLGEPIGKQDQYACACGGLNFIQFNPDDTVLVEKLRLSSEGYRRLENNLLLFYTGKSRSAGSILARQKEDILSPRSIENLQRMTALAATLREELMRNNIDAMGDILHEGWMRKKELASGITDEAINTWYETARQNGAVGGKLLGAGGGGFLLFYVKEENHTRVRKALGQLRETPFRFESQGTSLIHYEVNA